ncbi:holin [Bacillus phage Shbh1]|uniref:Putative holin n=1 Tax=Bacillus phage Shbh1 TaxID=1796992 RepID=A0A142F1J1_9CAUD|nr:holin [Bacillus phage Shbh1]AMQ66648.1 putative holin [Bacillus phage Shbh1]
MDKNLHDHNQEEFTHVEVPSLSPMMVVRTVVFLLAIINSVAVMFGFELGLEVNQENLYQLVSGVFLVGSGIVAWYKNNDITKKARIKAAKMKEDEGE